MNLYSIQDIKNTFDNKIEKAQYLKKIIRSLVEKGDFSNAKEKISEYKRIFPNDIEIASIETVMLMIKGEIDGAEEIALKGVKDLPFHFDLNYNLGFIYQTKEKHQDAANAFIVANSVATSEEEKSMIQDAINGIKDIDDTVDLSKMNQPNYKLFPLKTNDDTWIGKPLFKDKGGEGYIPLYHSEPLESYPTQLWNFYKTETLKGKIYEAGEVFIEIPSKSALPLGIVEKGTLIDVTVDNQKYKFDNFIPNRYYYIPIQSNNEVKIQSNNRFILGNPIPLNQNKEHDVKIVLNLFIDGLSQELINKYSLEKLMPNTYSFFKKGTIFNNCYSNAEWTLASVPTIFTGRYQANHKIFHPELLHSISDNYKSMGEYFKQDDYLTFQACGNWRKTPSYGYANGFDRMIYQSSTMGSKVEDIISSFLEQMRAFPDRNQFVWLTFFELHNIADNITSNISNQIMNSMNSRVLNTDTKKSVVKDYDEIKIEKYVNEISRIDYYLKTIYDSIEDKYDNDEILVSLFSDHGQSYLDDGDHILRDARTRVPFMIRGKGIPSTISNELMENVDILPTILYKASIEFDSKQLDGRITKVLGGKNEKEYVYSESIYPGSTYKAIIRDNEHTLIFESEGDVEQDGRFELGEFSIKLENSNSKKDETNENIEKVSKYFDIIISHIGSFLKI